MGIIGRSRWWLIFLISLTVVVRLALSIIARGTIDVVNYERVANTVLSNGAFSLYTQTEGLYPYPPFWVWLEVLAKILSQATPLSFQISVRLPVILADAGLVYVIWLWNEQRSPKLALAAGIAYALNPVSLIITCLHGQFDAIPVAFSVLALYFLLVRDSLELSALSIGLAIGFKSYPVLFLLPILLLLKNGRDRVLYSVIAVSPLVIVLGPFLFHAPVAVVQQLFDYRGAALLGFMVPVRTIIVPLTHDHFPPELTVQIVSGSRWIFLLTYFVLIVSLRIARVDLVDALVCILLLFYFVYGGIAPQYLMWIVGFWFISKNPLSYKVTVFTVTAALALAGFYYYAIPDIVPVLAGLRNPQLARLFYGMSGSLWWIACGALLVPVIGWKFGEARFRMSRVKCEPLK